LVSGHYQIHPNHVKDFQRLLQDITEPITKVVYLWGLDGDIDSQSSQTRSYASLLYLVQALDQFKTKETPKLWVITEQAQPVNDAVKPLKVAQTPLWGMGQVIALEYPNLWGGLIDLEEKYPSTQAIISEITGDTGEDRIAFRDHQRYVARLVPNKAIKNSKVHFKKAEASYLITGGLGSLGLSLADWLIEKGANHLILTSRRALADHSTDKQAKIKALQDKGATIQVIAADVSDYQQTRHLFHQIQESCPPLQGIIHAAGVLSDRTIENMDFDCFESVFNPKVAGAWNLHQLSQDLSLDFFVCFSSMSALIGSRGQIHYAAANHFLDGLMHYRRESGLTGLSINWGPWAKGGMATQGYEEGLKRMGINPLQPNLALDTLDVLINSDVTQTMVAEIDWSKFQKIVAAKGRVAFLEALFTQDQNNSAQPVENFPQTLQDTPPHRRVALLTTRLQQEVAKVLGIRSEALPDTDQGFFDLGMDSLMSVELKHRLEALFSVTVPSTLAFEYPTIGDVVQYFVQEVFTWEGNSGNSQVSSEIESTDAVELNQAFAELESLSEAETEALMEQELAELEALL
jgi:acyl carrier protein/NADP-dependent 3-hydroxy acid dehydrogenase YdfG